MRPLVVIKLALASLLAGTATAAQNVESLVVPDTAATFQRILMVERAFLSTWFETWQISEATRNGFVVGYTSGSARAGGVSVAGNALPPPGRIFRKDILAEEPPRRNAYWCLRPQKASSIFGEQIGSHNSGFAVCPGWFRGVVGDGVSDERYGIDNALAPDRRRDIGARRNRLLALLDSGVRAMPTNAWLVGQYVRFLVDQGEFARADAASSKCSADQWWCAALAGYAHATEGWYGTADSLFAVALKAMPAARRCDWNDHSLLLESTGRAAYGRLTCAARDSANAWLWWLSDPLWITPGNERRVEQYRRRMIIELRSALDRDERFDWRDSTGNDARKEMILRYGWPSYTYWGGPNGDTLAGNFQVGRGIPRNFPATTYEYTPGRHQIVPAGAALVNPFLTSASDWHFSAPVGGDSGTTLYPLWWPREHYAPPWPMVELGRGQVAVLRRDTHAVLAIATALDAHVLARAFGRPVPVTLVVTHRPETPQVVAKRTGAAGSTVVLRGPIPSQSTLVGLEIPPERELPAARLRFGLTPPPPLSAMGAGEVAISEPVLLQAWDETDAPPTETDAALDRMTSSTQFAVGGRVGVYWETYGVAPEDTVKIAVSVERVSRDGVVRRLWQALRLAADRNSLVEVGWQEPQLGHRAHVIAGAVPIVGRSVVLDLATLAPGEYALQVAVERPGQTPVHSRRLFTVR